MLDESSSTGDDEEGQRKRRVAVAVAPGERRIGKSRGALRRPSGGHFSQGARHRPLCGAHKQTQSKLYWQNLQSQQSPEEKQILLLGLEIVLVLRPKYRLYFSQRSVHRLTTRCSFSSVLLPRGPCPRTPLQQNRK